MDDCPPSELDEVEHEKHKADACVSISELGLVFFTDVVVGDDPADEDDGRREDELDKPMGSEPSPG